MLTSLKLAILSRLLPWLLQCPFHLWEDLLTETGKLDAAPLPNERKTQQATLWLLTQLRYPNPALLTSKSTPWQLARRAAQAAVLYRRIKELLTFPF